MRAVRSIVLLIPGWPVRVAASRHRLPASRPLALVSAGRVREVSPSAAAEGVHAGQRPREAQSLCPSLILRPLDPEADHRAFSPVFRAVEELAPGVQILEPGLCALRARGPSRYYGGEAAAAGTLVARLIGLGHEGARAAVADGVFAATHVARGTPPGGVGVAPEGRSAEVVGGLPVEALTDDVDRSMLLHRLGIHTLEQFAAITPEQARDRFGVDGIRMHTLARGEDVGTIEPSHVDRETAFVRELAEPLDRADQIVFTVRADVDALVRETAEAGFVATEIEIELVDENGASTSRRWRHPRFFREADVLDRLRWQIQGEAAATEVIAAPMSAVAVRVRAVDRRENQEEGLFGGSVDARVHHGITRVQSLLGHESIGTLERSGGRLLRERQQRVPWGERARVDRSGDRPWPGALSALPPTLLFERPRPVTVLDANGRIASVGSRGFLEAPLAAFGSGGETEPIRSWAGPWPVESRWWDGGGRVVHRFQIVDAGGTGWVLHLEDGGWTAEGRYD